MYFLRDFHKHNKNHTGRMKNCVLTKELEIYTEILKHLFKQNFQFQKDFVAGNNCTKDNFRMSSKISEC